MGKLRSIRLKEFDPNICIQRVPTDELLDRSNDTLSRGPFTVRTDENGFIKTGNDPNPDDRAITIIGGSFVESSFSHETDRFASQTERMLTGYRILNGGYSGSTTLQLFNLMVSKLYPLLGRTGKLVFFVGQSDVAALDLPGGYWNGAKLRSVIQPGFEPTATDLPTGYEAAGKVVELVIEGARILEMDVTLAISPFRVGDFSQDMTLRRIFRRDRSFFNRRMIERDSVRKATIEAASRHGIECIDFHGLSGGNPAWFYDDLHLNSYGQTEFAKLFTDELTKRL